MVCDAIMRSLARTGISPDLSTKAKRVGLFRGFMLAIHLGLGGLKAQRLWTEPDSEACGQVLPNLVRNSRIKKLEPWHVHFYLKIPWRADCLRHFKAILTLKQELKALKGPGL